MRAGCDDRESHFHWTRHGDARQQPDWGNPRAIALAPSKLFEIDWQIGPDRAYDIWIDDVGFLDCK